MKEEIIDKNDPTYEARKTKEKENLKMLMKK